MDKSPHKQKKNASLYSKIKDVRAAMSPITNLAQGFSCLTATHSKTPTRTISCLDLPSKLTNQLISDSPYSDDSPSFQEGVLKPIQLVTSSCSKSGRFRKFFKKSSINSKNDKENIPQGDNTPDFIKPKQSLCFNNNAEDDSSDEFPKTSQESGFGDSRSFTSRSNSIPSVHSSVFTDEELDDDDDDSLFAIDKLVEDDISTEVLSSSMTQLINSPLINSYDQFKFEALSETNQVEISKPLRRCLSMVIQSKDQGYRLIENNKIPSIIKENEISENEIKSNSKFAFKRPEPLDQRSLPLHCKRRKSSPVVTIPSNSQLNNKSRSPLVRCYSETAATIMRAVQKSFQNPDLIGDCSKPFILPLVEGRHQDLKSITGETLVKLLKGEFTDVKDFLLVDCRYPYEFNGGHIIGAKNIYTKDEIYNNFLQDVVLSSNNDQRNVIVFHCEFSSERAPKLLRFLRNKDRELNENSYPRLHHPEIYILDGGYKAFFHQYKEFCEPQDYKPMLHKDHSEELKEFQKEGKCKTWGKLRDTQTKGLKSLKFNNFLKIPNKN